AQASRQPAPEPEPVVQLALDPVPPRRGDRPEPVVQPALDPVPPRRGDRPESSARPVSPRAIPQPAVHTIARPASPPLPLPPQECGPPSPPSQPAPAAS